MKRLSFLLGILLSCSALMSTDRSNAIIANIGTALMGNFELSFERRLNQRISISTVATYYHGALALWRIYSDGIQLGLGFVPKIHIYGEAHRNSLYLGPSLRLGYLVHPAREAGEETDKGLLSRFGINFGYQHVCKNGLMFDLMTGIEHYHTFSFTKEKTRFQSGGSILVRPYYAASIGYAF